MCTALAEVGRPLTLLVPQAYNAYMTATAFLQSADYARLAVDLASEKQASDIVLLDIRGISSFADFFVILTVESTRQMRALAEEMEKALKGTGARLHHSEGTMQSGWSLLDFGDLIVHLFAPAQREFYHLEGVWSGAVEVVRIQ